MATDGDLRSALDEYVHQMAEGASGAKAKIKELIATEAGVAREAIAVSSARGGTKQTRNRLGQAEVQRATELALFVLDPDDSIQACVDYVIDAIGGRNDARPPIGPVAFMAPEPGGDTSVALIEGRPTKASRLIQQVYGVTSVDPRDQVKPRLPSGPRWLLMSSGEALYGDRDGVRYQFPTTIPNGQRINPGDVIVSARTKKSSRPDAGAVFGIGRVGRRVDVAGGAEAFVYFDRYRSVVPPISLEELGDPRKNVNSIVGLDETWVVSLMKLLGVADIEELPVPITALSLNQLSSTVREDGLIFDQSLIASVLAAIRSGKHVMLTGAPGTGKTSLALSVGHAAKDAALCNEALLTTGSADWTSADTVGSYRLTKENQLRFHAGHVTVAIEGDRWLIVDELNRADIDKAIGQLFTALSGQPVTLPFEEHDPDLGIDAPISIVPPGQEPPLGTIPKRITENWRLIATLNDRDRDLLFDMSEALMRRFAVIEVPTPSLALWREISSAIAGSGRDDWDAALEALVASPEFEARPLGVAVLLDTVHHLREITYIHDELDVPVDVVRAFQEALDVYIVPQLGTLTESVTIDASRFLPRSPEVEEAEAENPSGP